MDEVGQEQGAHHNSNANVTAAIANDPTLSNEECQQQQGPSLSWCDESTVPLEFDAETFPELTREYRNNCRNHHEKSRNSSSSISIINKNSELMTMTSSSAVVAKNPSDDDLLQHINVSNILGDADQSSEDITLDMTIPSEKVGLVIGRGGKTIKILQEKSGSKMNIIQATPSYEDYDKTLRLGPGPPDLVEHARQLVIDLISKTPGYQGQFKHHKNEYERSSSSGGRSSGGGGGGGGGRYNNNYNGGNGGGRFKSVRFPVPKVSVGLIIGKGGETIKRIRAETGAKVQFDPINASLGEMDEQAAVITGKPDQIRHACDLINELVDTAIHGTKKDRDGGSGRRGQFNRQNDSSTFYNDDHRHHQQNHQSRDYFVDEDKEEEERINVPSGKVKLVIGKGRESIRDIVAQSGAQCEIDRAVPPDSVEKTFILKGSRQQVDLAKEMILDKINPRPSKRHHPRGRGHYQQHQSRNSSDNYGVDYRQNNEWGQGDPGAPWTTPDPYYDPAQSQQQHQHHDRHFIGSNPPPNQGYGYAQWLEYFQPERQQAQADAWEQQVKAEQADESDPSPQQPEQSLTDIGDRDDQSSQHQDDQSSEEGHQTDHQVSQGGPPGFSPRPGHQPVIMDYGQNWSDQQRQQQQQMNESDRPSNIEKNLEEEDLDNFRKAQGDNSSNNLNATQYTGEGPSPSSSEGSTNNEGSSMSGQHHHHPHQIFMRPPPGLTDPNGQGQCPPHMIHMTGGGGPQNGQREPPPNIIQMNNNNIIGQGQIVMEGPPPPPCYPAFAYYYGHPVPHPPPPPPIPPNMFPAATLPPTLHHHHHHHPINLPAGAAGPPGGIIPGIQLPPLPPPPPPPSGGQPGGSCTRIVTLFYDINCNSIVVLNQWHFS